jgi:hypothetical protein
MNLNTIRGCRGSRPWRWNVFSSINFFIDLFQILVVKSSFKLGIEVDVLRLCLIVLPVKSVYDSESKRLTWIFSPRLGVSPYRCTKSTACQLKCEWNDPNLVSMQVQKSWLSAKLEIWILVFPLELVTLTFPALSLQKLGNSSHG